MKRVEKNQGFWHLREAVKTKETVQVEEEIHGNETREL
jgi:hypothetical protein